MHRPLELEKVAELKYVLSFGSRLLEGSPICRALLPEVVKFAYTPQSELRIHSDQHVSSGRRERSPDYSAFQSAGASSSRVNDVDADEHVLVLDFVDSSWGKKTPGSGYVSVPDERTFVLNMCRLAYALPPALTPAATKKLVERRNERFSQAVNE